MPEITGPITTVAAKSIDLVTKIVELRIRMLEILPAAERLALVRRWVKDEERFARFFDLFSTTTTTN